MRNKIDPQFADIAKGHVLETKDPNAALLSAGMEGLKLDDGEKDSDDDEKDTKWFCVYVYGCLIMGRKEKELERDKER